MSDDISEKPSSKKCAIHLIFIQFLMFLSTFVSCALTGNYIVKQGYYPNENPSQLCLDIWISNIIILVLGSIIVIYILLFTLYKILIGTITGNYKVSNGFSLCKGFIFFGAIGAYAFNIIKTADATFVVIANQVKTS